MKVPDDARVQLLRHFQDIGGGRRGTSVTLIKFDIAIGERLGISAKQGKRDRGIVEHDVGGLVDLVNLKNGDRAELTGRGWRDGARIRRREFPVIAVVEDNHGKIPSGQRGGEGGAMLGIKPVARVRASLERKISAGTKPPEDVTCATPVGIVDPGKAMGLRLTSR